MTSFWKFSVYCGLAVTTIAILKFFKYLNLFTLDISLKRIWNNFLTLTFQNRFGIFKKTTNSQNIKLMEPLQINKLMKGFDGNIKHPMDFHIHH